MTKKESKRRLAVKLYGHLYKRYLDCNPDKCFYCGDARQCLDHVPPVTTVENIDLKKVDFEFLLYPSCIKCNNYLNKYEEIDPYYRLSFLFSKYEKLINKIEPWTEEELNELGHNLRSMILVGQHKIDEYNKKLIHIDEQMLSLLRGSK